MKADAFVLLCASRQVLRPPLQLGNTNPSIKHKTRFFETLITKQSSNRCHWLLLHPNGLEMKHQVLGNQEPNRPPICLNKDRPSRSLAGRERNALCVVHRLTYCALIHCQVLSEYLIWALYEITYRYQLQKCILKIYILYIEENNKNAKPLNKITYFI